MKLAYKQALKSGDYEEIFWEQEQVKVRKINTTNPQEVFDIATIIEVIPKSTRSSSFVYKIKLKNGTERIVEKSELQKLRTEVRAKRSPAVSAPAKPVKVSPRVDPKIEKKDETPKPPKKLKSPPAISKNPPKFDETTPTIKWQF